jgi:hypothetical protein
MSNKQLIEQLAKEHLKRGEVIADHEGYGAFTVTANGEFVRYNDAAKMIKAYQAAAPIDNVAEALEKAASIAKDAESMWGDNFTKKYGDVTCEQAIRNLITDTQAKKGE